MECCKCPRYCFVVNVLVIVSVSVGLSYVAMERPGIELAASRSQVQRPNYYTTEQPVVLVMVLVRYLVHDNTVGERVG